MDRDTIKLIEFLDKLFDLNSDAYTFSELNGTSIQKIRDLAKAVRDKRHYPNCPRDIEDRD